ncbi:family 43 glycosylhydrolase [Sunxiuqinia sp. A32]|uniref:family 43 glycosylhydrolase n=1 Tax=Sunxiuqinia sp. A32 TaxID=3461496 RepID=UPI0040459C73
MMKLKFFALCFLLIVGSGNIIAQNPIVPPGIYVADPTARVWDDGKVYLYGSRDENPDYYCSWRYDVLSSDNMMDWEIYPNRISSKGEDDVIPYSDDLLFAPDCWYKDGVYYLYYCLANNTLTEGVAVSNSPTGPFVNGTNIELGEHRQIDPAVFVDDDGQAYYVWGQFQLKIAKLKPNMKEVDLTSVIENVITEKDHFFHEGAFLTKRKGIYYLVYAHMGRAGKPTCIGYATSNSPMGPYQYGGVIIDNDHCDPGNWNNHGSLVEFKDQWYIFYHRSTHGSYTMRKACIEPIFFNEDGSITEVEMTSQGAAGPLDPLKEIGAERACLMNGNVRIQAYSPNEEELGGIQNGDNAGYKYINFDKDVSRVDIRVAPGEKPGKIDIGVDNIWGPSIGSIEIPGGGDLKKWNTFSCDIIPVTGTRAVWLRFRGEGEDIFHVDSFQFK